MEKSICTYGFIPVRNEATERSEMVTQLLFGDTFDVIERADDWCKIQLHDDNYIGWINAKLVAKLSEKEVERWMNA